MTRRTRSARLSRSRASPSHAGARRALTRPSLRDLVAGFIVVAGMFIAGVLAVWLRSGSFPFGHADLLDYVGGAAIVALAVPIACVLWAIRRR